MVFFVVGQNLKIHDKALLVCFNGQRCLSLSIVTPVMFLVCLEFLEPILFPDLQSDHNHGTAYIFQEPKVDQNVSNINTAENDLKTINAQ